MLIQFCGCESQVATLTRHRLWPSAPKVPLFAYSYDFLDLVKSLRLECQTSVYSIVQAFKLCHSFGPFLQQVSYFINCTIRSPKRSVGIYNNLLVEKDT